MLDFQSNPEILNEKASNFRRNPGRIVGLTGCEPATPWLAIVDFASYRTIPRSPERCGSRGIFGRDRVWLLPNISGYFGVKVQGKGWLIRLGGESHLDRSKSPEPA